MAEGIKKCPECGAENNEFAIACSSCGYPFSSSQVKCSECGAMIPDNLDTCPSCGAPKNVNDSIGYSEKRKAVDPKKRYISYVMFALAIVFLIMAVRTRFFGEYDYYSEVIYEYEDNIDEYRDLKHENQATADSYSGGIFKYGYQDIANSYQGLIDDANDRIDYYESLQKAIVIKSAVFLIVAAVLAVIGFKFLNGGQLNGINKMSQLQ